MISIEESIPSKNNNYRLAEDIFYFQFNDVFFYIEDEEQENFFFNILKKIFPDINIDKIFPLNGKENVIKEALNNIDSKNKVYIVDKDFDDILNKKTIHPNLFYLDRYSIENFLIEENAIIEYIISEKPKLKRAFINQSFDLNNFLTDVKDCLQDLVLLFLVIQDKCPQLQNVNHGHQKFLSFSNGTFIKREDVINDYIDQIQQELNIKDKRIKVSAQTKKMRKKCFFNNDILVDTPGKYLIKMIKQIIESKFSLASRNIESFSYRLATYCSFDSLYNFQSEINDYLK